MPSKAPEQFQSPGFLLLFFYTEAAHKGSKYFLCPCIGQQKMWADHKGSEDSASHKRGPRLPEFKEERVVSSSQTLPFLQALSPSLPFTHETRSYLGLNVPKPPRL